MTEIKVDFYDEEWKLKELEIHPSGFVYFMRDKFVHPTLTKVGYTKDLTTRLKQFRTVLPDPYFVAVIPATREIEQDLHSVMKALNRHSFREWFILENFWDITGVVDLILAGHKETGPFGWYPIKFIHNG